MFGFNPPVEVNYFGKVGYGKVTAPISLHQPGQILFWGRYYSAELLKPRLTELAIGTSVLVFGERGFSLVVERDEALFQEA